MGQGTARTPVEIGARLLTILVSAGVFVFLVAPALAILPLSVNDSHFLTYPLRGLTLTWYEQVFASQKWQLAIQNSFLIGLPATFLATLLGGLAAIGLSLADFRGKGLVTGLLLSPLVVPIVIVAVGLYFFFAPFGLTQSYSGLIMAHAVLGAPFVVVAVSAALASLDRDLLRAGASLGADPATVLVRIMLPIIAPGVAAGALFAFATSFDEVVVVMLLSAPHQRTIPREMFSEIRDGINPEIAAVATIMTAVSVFLLLAFEWLRARSARLKGRPRG